jgi:hypothetical protein
MIFHTVYAIQNTLSVFNDAPDVFVQLLVMLWWNRFFSIVCAKYDVIQNLSITVHSFLFWATRIRVVVLLIYSATQMNLGVIHRIHLRCDLFRQLPIKVPSGQPVNNLRF